MRKKIVKKSIYRSTSCLLFVVALLAIQIPSAQGSVAEISIDLKAGKNWISLPFPYDISNNDLDSIFDDLSAIKSIQYFDSASQDWRVFIPEVVSADKFRLPSYFGLAIEAKQDVTFSFVGAPPSPPPKLPGLVDGWQLIGIGALKESSTGGWEPGEITWRKLTDQEVELDLEKDRLSSWDRTTFVEIKADDILSATKAYWLYREPRSLSQGADTAPNSKNPELDSITSLSFKSAEELEDVVNQLVSDYPQSSGPNEKVAFGAFEIRHVRYNLDGAGNRASGIGIIESLPKTDGINNLLTINAGNPFIVHLDYKEGKLVSVFADANDLSGNPENIKSVVIGDFGSAKSTKLTGKDILYLMIYKTKVYPQGILTVQLETDMMALLAKTASIGTPGKIYRPAYVQLFTSVAASSRVAGVIENPWIKLALPLGKEELSDVEINQVWVMEDDSTIKQVTRVSDTSEPEFPWLLAMPLPMKGIMDIQMVVDQDVENVVPLEQKRDPNSWLPMRVTRESKNDSDEIIFESLTKDTFSDYYPHHAVLFSFSTGEDGSLISIENPIEITIDISKSPIYTTLDGRVSIYEGDSAVSYEEGRIELDAIPGTDVRFFVDANSPAAFPGTRYARKKPKFSPSFGIILGNTSPWDLGEVGSIEDFEFRMTINPSIIVSLGRAAAAAKDHKAGLKSSIQILTGYFQLMLYPTFTKSLPEPEVIEFFAGSSLGFSADFRSKINFSTASGSLAMSWPASVNVTKTVRKDRNLEGKFSFDSGLEFSLANPESSGNAFEISADFSTLILSEIITASGASGEDVGADLEWTMKKMVNTIGLGIGFTVPQDAAFMAGTSTVINTHALLLGKVTESEIAFQARPVARFATESGLSTSLAEGWGFAFNEMSIRLHPIKYTVANNKNFFALALTSVGHYLKSLIKKEAGNTYPNLFYSKDTLVTAELSAPAELDEFGGVIVSLLAENKQSSSKTFWQKYDRYTLIFEPDLTMDVSDSPDIEIKIREVIMGVEFAGEDASSENSLEFLLTLDVISEGLPSTFTGILSRNTDGVWVLQILVDNLRHFFDDDSFRLDSGMLSISWPNKDSQGKRDWSSFWSNFSASITGVLDNPETKAILGEGLMVEGSGTIFFPGGTRDSATITVSVSNLDSNLVDRTFGNIPFFKIDRISNAYVKMTPIEKDVELSMDLDLFWHGESEPKGNIEKKNNSKSFTLGSTFHYNKGPGGATKSIEMRGGSEELVLFDPGNEKLGGSMTFNQIKIAKTIAPGGLAQDNWTFDLDTTIELPTDWTKIQNINIPNTTGSFKIDIPDIYKVKFGLQKIGGSTGLYGSLILTNPIVNDISPDVKVNLTEIFFSKASPWSAGLKGSLELWGETVDTSLAFGQALRLVVDKQITMPLSEAADDDEEKVDLKVDNFFVGLNPLAIGGNVSLLFPEEGSLSLLKDFFGDQVAATLSGQPTEFWVKYPPISSDSTTSDVIGGSIDMGKIGGEAAYSLNSLEISSLGVVKGKGSITISDKTVGLEISILPTGGIFLTADFGAFTEGGGIEIDVDLFKLRLQEKIGFKTIAGFQFIQIDDLDLQLGNDTIGLDVDTEKFTYFLPTSIPPIGFAFCDSFTGNVHIVGFAVNAGFEFPAPTGENLLTFISAMVEAAEEGTVDWNKLADMDFPRLALKDVYVKFPKVPGPAFKNGQFTTTDNVFASIFGSNKLELIDRIDIKPAKALKLAYAESAYEVIEMMIPEDKRKASSSIDLRGFKASASYELRGDEPVYEDTPVPDINSMHRSIKAAQYLNQQSQDLPIDIYQTLLTMEDNIWYGADLSTGRSGVSQRVKECYSNQATILFDHDLTKLPEGEYRIGIDMRCGADTIQNHVVEITASINGVADSGVTFKIKGNDFKTGKSLQSYLGTVFGLMSAIGSFTQTIPQVPDSSAYGYAYATIGMFENLKTLLAHGLGSYPSITAELEAIAPLVAMLATTARTQAAGSIFEHLQILRNLVEDKIYGDDIQNLAFQRFFFDYRVSNDTRPLRLKAITTGLAEVGIGSIRVMPLGVQSEKVISIPENLGGGTGSVNLEIVDLSKYLESLKELVSAISVPENQGWRSALDIAFQHLMEESEGGVEPIGDRLRFEYSKDLFVDLNLIGANDSNKITGLRVRNGKLYAKHGNVTLTNWEGTPYLLTDDVLNIDEIDGWKAWTTTYYGAPTPHGGPELIGTSVPGIEIENGGRFFSFSEVGFSGIPMLNDLTPYSDSIQVYFPLNIDTVAGWKLSITSIETGVLAIVDAGGIEVIFSNNQKLLWMQNHSRLRKARDEMGQNLGALTPWPKFTEQPGIYLDDLWKSKMVPNKASGGDNGITAWCDIPDGKGAKNRLSVTPVNEVSGYPYTGVRFDRNTGNFLLKRGRIILYDSKSVSGESFEVTDDMPDLGAFKNRASSVKSLSGGQARLFPYTGYREDKLVKDWGNLGQNNTVSLKYEAVRSGTSIYSKFGKKHSGYSTNLYDLKLLPGEYKVKYDAQLLSYNPSTFSATPNLPYPLFSLTYGFYSQKIYSQPLQTIKGSLYNLAFLSIPDLFHTATFFVPDLSNGNPVATYFKGQNADVFAQFRCSNLILYEIRENELGGEYLDKVSDWNLANNPKIGDNNAESVKVFVPTNVLSTVKDYTVTWSLPEVHGELHLIHDSSNQATPSLVIANLLGSDRRIKVNHSPNTGTSITAITSDAYEFPAWGYTLYEYGKPVLLDDLSQANDHVRIVRKSIILPDKTLVKYTPAGAMSATLRGHEVQPEPGRNKSKFSLSTPNAGVYEFNVNPMPSDDLRYGKPTSGENNIVPTYLDSEGYALGIRKQVGVKEGGFFIDADLSAGDAGIVQLNVSVSGSIEKDGDFYFSGAGNLIIADYTIAEAQIELSSEGGLYVLGKVDVFDIAVVEVEGYIKPNGDFSLSGSLKLGNEDFGLRRGYRLLPFCRRNEIRR